MDRVRLPTDKPNRLAFFEASDRVPLQLKDYYRAEIRQGSRVIAALRGRYNSQATLDDWLIDNWPGNLSWGTISELRPHQELVIWKCDRTIGTRVSVHARWQDEDALIDNPPIETDDLLWLKSKHAII